MDSAVHELSLPRRGTDRRPGAPLPLWDWPDCLAGIGAALVALLVLLTIAAIAGHRQAGQSITTGQLVVSVVVTVLFEIALFAIAYMMTAGKYGGGIAALGWRALPIRGWIGYSALACFLAFVILGVYAAITALPGLHAISPKSNVPKELFDHRSVVVPAVLLTTFAAPLAEESFFRGFLFQGFRKQLGFAGAATVSGIIFSVAHGAPTLIIPYTAISVVFAWTYLRTGTLWSNVTAHFLFNLTSVVLTLAKIG